MENKKMNEMKISFGMLSLACLLASLSQIGKFEGFVLLSLANTLLILALTLPEDEEK